ncbi:MAG: excinuclease ABC subunit UvrB [Christensenellaceae bacterium]|nr:excinuclease ABC subunit UvrB [Christensenellaceae bacterium]
MDHFKLVSKYKPMGDQPEAIAKLTEGIKNGLREQVLLGVTGSGKTFTMANIIANINRPTLVLAHNKTLAAQLCSEFREYFPENAVEYFVSFYDYYRPEAYIPTTDVYIEKEAESNEEIEKLRHSATAALQERRDVIVVASVSCIYGLGDPKEYKKMAISIRQGAELNRADLLSRLVGIQYERNDVDFFRGTFRVRGDCVEIFPPSSEDKAVRVEFFGDEVDRICEVDVLSGKPLVEYKHIMIFPNTHYIAGQERMKEAVAEIEKDMREQEKLFVEQGKLLEAQRISQRTGYDIEMIKEIGYCSGIENYSRYMDGRAPGEAPYTLLDYFPDDFLLMVDESHATLPQVRSMYLGDRARKERLVEFGFRLPSALDNRPLNFDEFWAHIGQLVCVSATPAEFELSRAGEVAEQIVRPTGLLDPEIIVVPVQNQIDDLVARIGEVTKRGYRTLVTTLTKRMAEMLTDYLNDMDIKAKYMHSDVHTLERMELIRDLRLGEYDVLVGINLLREGLDLPEVAMVAILDADKEGFLRSERSLIQTIGRAARNSEGKVILYADRITDSMKRAMDETSRRRAKQDKYNKEHGIIPRTIIKPVSEVLEISRPVKETGGKMDIADVKAEIARLEKEMLKAAKELDFEAAAKYRDALKLLRLGIEN